jgi:hypothetical protein
MVHAATPREPVPGGASAGTAWRALAEVAGDSLARRNRVLLWVLEKVGVVETWVSEEGKRLPARRYLDHTPQYVPPSRPPDSAQ